jgi:hypothetical protein
MWCLGVSSWCGTAARGAAVLKRKGSGFRGVLAAAVSVLLVAGCARASGEPRGDPAVRVAAAVLALERSSTPLTPQQARQAIPLLEALRDLRPEEREAARALVQRFDALLTPAQRQALRAARERLRERGSGVGLRPSPDPRRVAEFRGRLVERALRVLLARAGSR